LIISNKYKFIYIAVPKTGSQNIRSHLSKFKDDTLRIRDHERLIPKGKESYIKIVSIRNPYDRILSQYKMVTRKQRQVNSDKNWLTFEEFIDYSIYLNKYIPDDTLYNNLYQRFPMWKFFSTVGKIDYFIRLEHIQKDFNALPFINEKVHIIKRNVGNYIKNSLNDKIIEKINVWAGKDFELYGYTKR